MNTKLILASLLLIAQAPVWAQQCAGPMKIVVGLAAGGGADVVARTLAQRFTTKFGHTVIVENKAGAGGNIATEFVAKSAPDGCTLLVRGPEHHVNAIIYSRPGYTIKDFVPVSRVALGTVVILANPNAPFKTVAGMIEYAKANPDKLSYGSTGIGGGTHVAMEMFMRATGTRMVGIQYKGGAASIADTVAGILPMTATSAAVALPLINAGKVVPLVVTTPNRWRGLPNVPTVAEAGYPDATIGYWMGLLAPAATPLAVREKLNQEVQAILDEPAIKERLQAQGLEAAPSSIQNFEKFLQADEQVNRKLMQQLNLKIE